MLTAPAISLPPTLPGWRAVTLDGAQLHFHRGTGTHVRIANDATAGLQRSAPRVAMFGITNACNLDCDFCSRDRALPSRWTVASAAAVLCDLAAAGTLEVAFGGGEPFAFPGFAELLAAVRPSGLALHATTNGTLIPGRWAAYAGLLDMVRVSIYGDGRWRAAGETLSAAGQRWGANVLVDDAALAGLPDLLAELAAGGAADVAVLPYVGAGPAHALSGSGKSRLAALIADAPLPVRLSVCAGDGVQVPLLHRGLDGRADCGAGRDFVSITPDMGMMACSFQDRPIPIRSAEDILTIWRERQARLSGPSRRSGCARNTSRTPAAPWPAVAVWRSFAGNNSGECVLVATFATVKKAEKFLGELLPGWVEGEPFSDAWIELFRREAVMSTEVADHLMERNAKIVANEFRSMTERNDELLTMGRSVFAVGYGLGHIYEQLETLAVKRGAQATGHTSVGTRWQDFLAVIRCRDAADARAVAAVVRSTRGPDAAKDETLNHRQWLKMRGMAPDPLASPGECAWPHGRHVIVFLAQETVSDARLRLTTAAAARPFAVDLIHRRVSDDAFAAQLLTVRQHLGHTPEIRPRLCLRFAGSAAALAFARLLRGRDHVVAGHIVLIDPVARAKRYVVLAGRHGGHAHHLLGREIRVNARFQAVTTTVRRKTVTQPIAPDPVQALLAGLPDHRELMVGVTEHGGCHLTCITATPGPVLTALVAHAQAIGSDLSLGLSDLDPLAWALRRLIADTDVGEEA